MQNNFRKFKKAPLLISSVFFILSCAAFIFLYQTIENNYRTAAEIEVERQTETARKDEIKSLDNSLKMMEVERASLNTHFVQNSDIASFLDTIEKLASAAGAKAEVTQVDISPDSADLIVGVRSTGTFESLYKFLTLLENSSYPLEFVSMNMQRTNYGGGTSDSISVSEWSAVFSLKLLSFLK